MPWWQYVALGVPLFMWLGVVFVIFAPPLDSIFINRFFAWLPDWFFLFGRRRAIDWVFEVRSCDHGNTQSALERHRRTCR